MSVAVQNSIELQIKLVNNKKIQILSVLSTDTLEELKNKYY